MYSTLKRTENKKHTTRQCFPCYDQACHQDFAAGGTFFKYNIGCMQQLPRKKLLATFKFYSHLT